MFKTRIARAVSPVLIGVVALGAVAPAGAAQAYGSRSIPANTVVQVKLDERLSSRTARVGDRFMARLSDEDRSGFPEGTRFEGTVTEVQSPSSNRPGVLATKFHRAILPDGRMVQATAFPASLEDEDIRRAEKGRLESRTKSRGDKLDLKWLGYGAAGGAVLSTIFGGGFLKGALLGGLGGAVYSYINRDKGRKGDYHDVELSRGTEFGIRLYDRVSFADSREYRYASGYDRDERYNDRDQDRDNDRDYDRNRDRDEDRYNDRDRDQDSDRYEDRDRDADRNTDRDRNADRIPDRDRNDGERRPAR